MANNANAKQDVVIVGAGQMGQYYLPTLLNRAMHISVVDINEAALQKCAEKCKEFPIPVNFTTDLQHALRNGARILMNLVNSPAHLDVLKTAVEAKVPFVYSEKPVVTACHLGHLKALVKEQKTTQIITAYVINYSAAVRELVSKIENLNLRILHASVEWGKSRWMNSRPTAGVIEDEICHGVRLMRYLLERSYGRIRADTVSGDGSPMGFADPEVQRKAHERDDSFPLDPLPMVQFSTDFHVGQDRIVKLFQRSSFMCEKQEREMRLVLGGEDDRPAYFARLAFDISDPTFKYGKDTLEFGPVGGTLETTPHSANKLDSMMESFMQFSLGSALDGRLCDVWEAMDDVNFSQMLALSVEHGGKRLALNE